MKLKIKIIMDLSEEPKEKRKRTEKHCPTCNSIVTYIGMYYCRECKKYYEDIDFLDLSEEEIDEDCKKCFYLKGTEFKKNDQQLFVCNCLKSDRIMEKINDFRKCICFKEKTPPN